MRLLRVATCRKSMASRKSPNTRTARGCLICKIGGFQYNDIQALETTADKGKKVLNFDEEKDNDSLFQSSCMTIYITVAVTYQFLLSNSADQLTTEARRLATVTYYTPWYRMKKQDADLVRQVLRTTNSPIQVTAYKTAVFLLNRETFAGFIATTLSAFVTLCQMKDLYDE